MILVTLHISLHHFCTTQSVLPHSDRQHATSIPQHTSSDSYHTQTDSTPLAYRNIPVQTPTTLEQHASSIPQHTSSDYTSHKRISRLLFPLHYKAEKQIRALNKCHMPLRAVGRDSSIGIANSLRAGRSGDGILVGARFSAPVQTGPGAHPVSCTVGTGSYPGDTAAGAWR